jgi:hypothetical protein
MLSSPVYVNTETRSAALHPRQPISRVRLSFFSFCPSQPSNLQTFQRANALSASRTQLLDAIQTPSNACHPRPLPSRQHRSPLSPLSAPLTDHRTSVANKRLTENLTPLDATLTKNRGRCFHRALRASRRGVYPIFHSAPPNSSRPCVFNHLQIAQFLSPLF